MKQLKSIKSFTETTDARDGLFPSLRYALAQMQVMNDKNNGNFRKSSQIAENIADKLQTDYKEVYDTLINATWPRCELPLVDGHGNMGFPPADMWFSEMRVSDFYREVSCKNKSTDFNTPFLMPFPYVLSNGTISHKRKNTTIPPHNLSEIIDATIALIKNPTLETKELMQYINGPDLIVGGEIEDKSKLCEVYENGSGVIEVKITPQTASERYFDEIPNYCGWYGFKLKKCFFKKEQRILIPYNAILFDGETTKFMSLKEILKKYIEYYKSIEKDLSDETFCEKLVEYKNLFDNRER